MIEKVWSIDSYADLKKIPTFGEDEITTDDRSYLDAQLLREKKRITGLRRRKLIRGDEITERGFAFVRHCLQDYEEFKGKLALCHSTSPDSYPSCREDDDIYWICLAEANNRIREDVFECSSLLEEAPRIVQDALDINARFGQYQRPQERNGRTIRPWHANWNCYGGNGWGADDQYLVSDYDDDHFWSIIEDYPDHDFETAAQAFASVYYELWALLIWASHYKVMTSPEELMYRWRWELAHITYDERCDDISDALHLAELRWQFQHSKELVDSCSFGVVSDPLEYAAESDEALESLGPYVDALEATVVAIHGEVAAGMRALGYIIVGQRGDYQCVLDNGARTTRQPFLDTVKGLILGTYTGPAIAAHEVEAFRQRAYATLSAPRAQRYAMLPGPFLKAKANDSQPA